MSKNHKKITFQEHSFLIEGFIKIYKTSSASIYCVSKSPKARQSVYIETLSKYANY